MMPSGADAVSGAAGHHGGDKYYLHGTHRTVSPVETLSNIERHLRHVGITRVANVTGLDRIGIPVAVAVRPNARSLAVSQGKGIELEAARASAVMESIEIWHAENLRLAQRRASAAELRAQGVSVVDTARLARARAGDADATRLFWVEGEDLLGGAACYVPLECVSADYTLPGLPGDGVFSASTNGLASGNSDEEALCHALCEVIERDAQTLWRVAGARALASTGVVAASVRSPLAAALMERFARASVDVRLWDLTSDVGVPTYCAMAIGDDADWADPEFGTGCHPDPEVALCRALTEAAQARVTFISGSRDDLGSDLYSAAAREARRRECRRLAAAHRESRAFDAQAGVRFETFSQDRAWLLARLAAVGVEQVVRLDLSHHELGISVQRVVIPGLEGPSDHEHCDYLPGERARRMMAQAVK